MHLGLPCTSWSRARKHNDGGPPPLRDDHSGLWGLQNLSQKDGDKVALGNQLLFASLQIIEACFASDTPWSLENPLTSRVWLTDMLQNLLRQGAVLQHTTFCMCGTPWRKATSFMTWHCPNFHFPFCAGSFQACSRTGLPHVPLRGKNAQGEWRTKVAQPYPPALCRLMAVAFRSCQ